MKLRLTKKVNKLGAYRTYLFKLQFLKIKSFYF
jgi:hypothetical protein